MRTADFQLLGIAQHKGNKEMKQLHASGWAFFLRFIFFRLLYTNHSGKMCRGMFLVVFQSSSNGCNNDADIFKAKTQAI